MLRIRNLILFFLLCSPFLAISQNTLTIIVDGVKSSSGFIAVAVFADEDSFLEEDKAFTGVFAKAELGATRIEIPNLPNDRYAISIFHDENNNGKMDTNFIGIPKEDYGCSNNASGFMGPPKWSDAKFELKADQTLSISL